MAFDQSKIGNLTAELMENLEAEFGDDAEIGDVALVVEIITPEHLSQIATTHTSPRAHVNVGLHELAREVLLKQLG